MSYADGLLKVAKECNEMLPHLWYYGIISDLFNEWNEGQ